MARMSYWINYFLFKYNDFSVGWDCVCQEERWLPFPKSRFQSCAQKSDIFFLSLIKVTSGSGYLILLTNSLSPNTNLTTLILLLSLFFSALFSNPTPSVKNKGINLLCFGKIRRLLFVGPPVRFRSVLWRGERETPNCRVNQYVAVMLGDPLSKGGSEICKPWFWYFFHSTPALLVIIVAVVCMLF